MKWSVLTLVGADQPGIVAKVTQALADADCLLGEASMMQLGNNFAIMLRVRYPDTVNLSEVLAPVADALGLHIHIDEDASDNGEQPEPDVHITVYGADRSGIVAQVSSTLARAGLNITDLETAVGGSRDKPIYIMTIEGTAGQGVSALQQAIEQLSDDIEVHLVEIETLRG